MKEDQRSLEKRPEITPGPLVKGSLESIEGSLMSMVGFGLERITRERAEVPPGLKLPERPVYFLDPSTRRLVMISHRESRRADYMEGLFAEIVELDEEGRPHYYLSTSDVILTGEAYQSVVVGPNEFGFPPSHIEVVEEEEVEGKEKKFVPWNLWLGQLQLWMNEIKIDPNEDFETFVNRFIELRERSRSEGNKRIKEAFPESHQGIDEKTVPINLIITDKGPDSILYQSSLGAGFYPILLDPKRIYEIYDEGQKLFKKKRGTWELALSHYLPGEYSEYKLAVITKDEEAITNLVQATEGSYKYHQLNNLIDRIRQKNPIFSFVSIMPGEGHIEPIKDHHGMFYCPDEEEMYRGLLTKLKADLLLTMFIRGGAPIVKQR